MDTKKRLTIQELIKMKDDKENKGRKELYIDSLGGNIVIKKPDRSLCQEVIKMATEKDENADLHMVYNSIIEPNLKEPSLHEAYKCISPFEILEKLFEPGEIAAISTIALEMAGYKEGIVKAVDDVKN